MSPRLITRSPAIYQLWPLILAINSLGTALAITSPRPEPGLTRLTMARANLRLSQVMAATGQSVTGLVMSLAPRSCIAGPPFRFLPHIDEYPADTAGSPQARDSGSCDAKRAARAPARQSRRHPLAFPGGKNTCLRGWRQTLTAASLGD